MFGQLYVKTGEMEKEIGRGLNTALGLPNKARYKPDAIVTKGDAKEILGLAERLIRLVSERMSDE